MPPALPPAQADREMLRRVLVNLAGNAIKFTPQGGSIRLTAYPPEQGFLKLAVSDTGPGIPPGYEQRIFEKFGQVESKGASHKLSTGLGLTFCKMAVEAHGGHIGVDSVVDEGSTFWVTWPIAPEGS